MPTVSNLVKKTDYNTKINETEIKITDQNHDTYLATPEIKKLKAEKFAAGLTQANLTTRKDIANYVNKNDFDDKLKNLNNTVTSNKTKRLLVDNELKNHKHFIQGYLLVKVNLIMMGTSLFNLSTNLQNY